MGTWKVWRFKSGLGEKEEGVMFKGGRGWYPKAHYGCFWVVFWQELGKMSILFKILTSDDMQDDASDILGLYWRSKKWSKLGQKTDFFGSFWEVFCLFPFTQFELRLKILVNERPSLSTYLRGKFHQYSICGCEFKNFRSFSCLFSIHKIAPFWDFLGPYFPKYCSTLLKFWPEVVSNGLFQKKTKQGQSWVHTFLKTPLELLGLYFTPGNSR